MKHLLTNAIATFKNETPSFAFAFDFDESVPFVGYINKLEGWVRGRGLPDKFVSNTFLVVVLYRGRLSGGCQ